MLWKQGRKFYKGVFTKGPDLDLGAEQASPRKHPWSRGQKDEYRLADHRESVESPGTGQGQESVGASRKWEEASAAGGRRDWGGGNGACEYLLTLCLPSRLGPSGTTLYQSLSLNFPGNLGCKSLLGPVARCVVPFVVSLALLAGCRAISPVTPEL